MTNSDLRQRAERIGSLLDQRDDIDVEIKAAFEIAKNDGFNPKELRRAIKVHRMDDKQRAKHDRDAEQSDLFLAEIEGRSMRDAAE
mgnify:CR=1 FL=1